MTTPFSVTPNTPWDMLANQSVEAMVCTDVLRFCADAEAELLAMGRVLKPNGMVQLTDMVAPTKKLNPVYFDALLGLLEPNLVRTHNRYEWTRYFAKAGLTIVEQTFFLQPVSLAEIHAFPHLSDYLLERLHILLLQAPSAIRAHIQPSHLGTPFATFALPKMTVVLQKMAQ